MIMVQCPICRRKQAVKNKVCPCGESLEKAKKNGRAKYWVSYYTGKKLHREIVGTSYTEAVAAEGKRKVQKIEGQKILDIKDKSVTFNQLKEWFKDQPTKQNLKYFPILMINLSSWCSEYGHYGIYSITALDIKNFRIKRKAKGLSDSYVDQEVGAVRNMLNTAWEGEKISGEAIFPFKKVRKLLKKHSNARDVVLSFDDLNRILSFMLRHARDITLTAFHTGMRRGEIVNLTWDRVDLKKRIITLKDEHTKTGRGREIPINESLHKILSDIPQSIHGDRYVFLYKGLPVKDIRASLKSACDKSGIPYGRKTDGGVTFHDLRHTFVTNMRRAGVHEKVLMDITGHMTREMQDRYDKVDSFEKSDAVDLMDKAVITRNDQKPAKVVK